MLKDGAKKFPTRDRDDAAGVHEATETGLTISRAKLCTRAASIQSTASQSIRFETLIRHVSNARVRYDVRSR